MADIETSVAIWDICADDISLSPNEQSPGLLRLHLTKDFRLIIGGAAGDAAQEAAAMRRLAEVAAEASAELERRVKSGPLSLPPQSVAAPSREKIDG
jgi:hypothetical protein